MLLPWPTRDQRQAAILAAQQQKEQSRATAGYAARITRDIERMAAENHFAGAIAEQIIRHHRGAP